MIYPQRVEYRQGIDKKENISTLGLSSTLDKAWTNRMIYSQWVEHRQGIDKQENIFTIGLSQTSEEAWTNRERIFTVGSARTKQGEKVKSIQSLFSTDKAWTKRKNIHSEFSLVKVWIGQYGI